MFSASLLLVSLYAALMGGEMQQRTAPQILRSFQSLVHPWVFRPPFIHHHPLLLPPSPSAPSAPSQLHPHPSMSHRGIIDGCGSIATVLKVIVWKSKYGRKRCMCGIFGFCMQSALLRCVQQRLDTVLLTGCIVSARNLHGAIFRRASAAFTRIPHIFIYWSVLPAGFRFVSVLSCPAVDAYGVSVNVWH